MTKIVLAMLQLPTMTRPPARKNEVVCIDEDEDVCKVVEEEVILESSDDMI